jgi:hypothetical protein
MPRIPTFLGLAGMSNSAAIEEAMVCEGCELVEDEMVKRWK